MAGRRADMGAIIEGKLVRLRPAEMDDLDRNTAWMNDAEVTRHLSMRYPLARDAEEQWMRDGTSAQLSYTNAFFAIETKEGGVHIGNVNFHQVIAENRKARLGVAIGDKTYWSRGYGTDALVTLCRFGFEDMNLHRIDLLVDADNLRAQACYRKVGFVEEGRLRQVRSTRGRYVDQLVMGVLRREFDDLHGAD
jgi:RimJ/RimL family protein N-acetyltransferase